VQGRLAGDMRRFRCPVPTSPFIGVNRNVSRDASPEDLVAVFAHNGNRDHAARAGLVCCGMSAASARDLEAVGGGARLKEFNILGIWARLPL